MKRIRILVVLMMLCALVLSFTACGSNSNSGFTISISMDYEELMWMYDYNEGNQYHFGEGVLDEDDFEKSTFTINVTDLKRSGEVATFSGNGTFTVGESKYPYSFEDSTLKVYELSNGKLFYDGSFETEITNIKSEAAIANIGVSFLEDYSKGTSMVTVRDQSWGNEGLLIYGDVFEESQEAFNMDMQSYQGGGFEGSFEIDGEPDFDLLDLDDFEPEE